MFYKLVLSIKTDFVHFRQAVLRLKIQIYARDAFKKLFSEVDWGES